MFTFIKKPYHWTEVFSVFLAFAVTLVLLDTFVIEHTEAAVSTTTKTTISLATVSSSTEAVTTEMSYKDDNIQITIETVREYDTTFYVADIQVSSVAYLKTAFANSTYGRNIKETTSEMAEENNAIFAINGDYYGFRSTGYVIRNGVLYREDASENDALVIDSDGNFSIVDQSETDAQTLLENGAWQAFSFGPALINKSEITVSSSSEVDQSMTSNPRTAIGQVSELHYIIIVSDGRTDESEGLSLLTLAEEFAERGCTIAYNLDGGGSSTMWFGGEVINNPTDGHSDSERSVSDIVYFGYE